MQPGGSEAEPPDKLEKSAVGGRRAPRDECWRHVRKLVYKVREDGHVEGPCEFPRACDFSNCV